MILKGSQRGGARQLGVHLLKTEENEHVEIHEIRGFMAEDVIGALREAEAISKGTKCRQFLFSVSLNPPERENVRIDTFEGAIDKIEERNGLRGQPRVIVFHEKEGRRHAHAVWSRIDSETMTAKPMSYFKNRLRDVSKELYLENGWQMPRGLVDSAKRDPRNFSLSEWQQAKRIGRHAGELKGMIQEAWAISDSRQTFSHALEERGFYLARGDKRGHVALTFEGEVISVSRATGRKAEEIRARLGDPSELKCVEKTRERIAEQILPTIKDHIEKARSEARRVLAPLEANRAAMAKQHALERQKVDEAQKARWEREALERAGRLRKGVSGLWDRLIGKYAKTEKQNEIEALWALRRDRDQRQELVEEQLRERRSLQSQIKKARTGHTTALRDLHFDLTNYRLMKRGQEPKLRPQSQKPDRSAERVTPELNEAGQKPARAAQKNRLERLRERTIDPKKRLNRDSTHEPDIER